MYLPVLLLLLLIIPAFLIYYLKKNKDKLYDQNFQMMFGFIYQEYRKECYYMELIKLGIKLLIMIIDSIYKGNTQLQISIIQYSLVIYLMVIIKVRPYSQHSANTIELFNTFLNLSNMILV